MKNHFFSNIVSRSSLCSIMLMACRHQSFSQASPNGMPQASSAAGRSPDSQTGGFVLRVTTREVLVDVVALDQHQRPVRDLTESDFRIYEIGKRSKKVARSISSFRIVDPTLEDVQTEQSSGGFRIALINTCAMANRFHYRLAYHPSSEGWTEGYHEILIATSRSKVELSFRQRYYVGQMNVSKTPRIRSNSSFDAIALQRAACLHSEIPPSIALSAHQIQTSSTDPLGYSLVVRPDSLAFTSMSDQIRRVQLDYGACTFGADGKSLEYSHTSAEKILSAKDYEQVLVHGYQNLLELSRKGDPTVARIDVRDRETGNIGSIDVPTVLAAPIELTTAQLKAAKASATTLAEANVMPGSFGSILNQADSLCGDVYEVTPGAQSLPDYENMEPIGAVYTHSLNVHYRYALEGLPGVTSRPEWFGIDYYGEFWVTMGGVYKFRMTSDDGSELWIDDKLVANLDGVHTKMDASATVRLEEGLHTIHVPYFQQTEHVALTLEIKAPGEEFKVFDLRDFKKPNSPR